MNLSKHLTAPLMLCGIFTFALPASSPADPAAARAEAQGYFEAREVRKATAVLVAAAAEHPEDRTLGAMLYAAVRDHVWNFPQTLPFQHAGEVRALVFTPDGKRLISGSSSGEVFVSPVEALDAEEAEAQRVKLTCDAGVVGLAVSKDGTRLAAVSAAGSVQVWELPSGRPLASSAAPAGQVTAFAKAAEADLFAFGTEAGSMHVQNFAGGKAVAEISQKGGAVRALALSRSGSRLAAVTGNSLAAPVWEVATGQQIGRGASHRSRLHSVDFSADERYVASAGEDAAILLSDPSSGVAVLPRMACSAAVRKLVVSPDGSTIAAILADDSASFWDLLTGRARPFFLREDEHFTDFRWARTGLRAATVSEQGNAALWSMFDGHQRGETIPLRAPGRVVAWSDNARFLATGTASGTVHIWHADGGLPLPTVRWHRARARTAFYSPDGANLVTTSEDRTAVRWRAGRVEPIGPALQHRGKVTCAVYSPDATRILTSDDAGLAQLWHADTGQTDGPAFTHKDPVQWVDFHPDGQRCLTAAGGTVAIWNVTARTQPLATLSHPGKGQSQITSARFSPDGKWIVTGSTDGTARVWDAATYRASGIVLQRGFPVLCVRFSPSGSRLVVAGEDGHTEVFDTATWKPIGVPVVTPGPVFSAAITPDDRFLVLVSFLYDAVQFFEIESGRPVTQGLTLPAQPTSVDYHPTEKVVVAACDDGTVHVVEAPFVTQDVPPSMLSFTERLIGLRKVGPDAFEPVESHFEQLRGYVSNAARGANTDFAQLIRWKLSRASQRSGLPRFWTPIAASIEQRVEERRVEALFECFESVAGEPLILGALSLFLPNSRHGEYLADLVLGSPDASPLARCYAAARLLRAGRSEEGEAVITAALTAAPEEERVLRRAAKFHANRLHKTEAFDLFARALTLNPNDGEARRSYAWALYEFGEPEKAAEQFLLAQAQRGEVDDDTLAGLCLSAAAQRKDAEAIATFQRLLAMNPDWGKSSYIASLRGWSQKQLSELERVRQKATRRKP